MWHSYDIGKHAMHSCCIGMLYLPNNFENKILKKEEK